ncbi:MAG: indolepyruvate oxidoreductase subunit beta family protein [Pseudomonadota bacterium]|nr:indolepyruvate oxidoreductase subunit beta family protein [Pseudomonadota bacterium]
MSAPARARPLSILIAALGGQGGGVLAQWLVEASLGAGFVAQSTSIPGVAQRTGATTYYIELFPVPIADLHGRLPVLSLYPTPGAVDIVLASELVEAARVMQAGMISPDRTHLITSTSRTLTTAEKMALGEGRYSSERVLAVARAHSRVLTTFDMDAAAHAAATLVSSVMLGAIAESGELPVAVEHFEAVIGALGTGVEASLRGFAAGREAFRHAAAARNARDDSHIARSPAVLPASADTAPAAHEAFDGPPATAGEGRPLSLDDVARLGEARVIEYQDAQYGEIYRERVARVDAAERAADPAGAHGRALTREYARYLALWMTFDDIVRVAALKVRASRFARVRREVGATSGDVVRIIDHFKPRVPEVAGLMPRQAATRLMRWDTQRQGRGRAPLAFALHLRADSIFGLLALRALAALRRWRRHGLRYSEEQSGIERWTGAVVAACAESWALGNEVALCGRLVKGYGETNERGKRNLSHILDHLLKADASRSGHAQVIREARLAALADEAGQALDATLVRHGAPPRPVRAQPIRWSRKPAQKREVTP